MINVPWGYAEEKHYNNGTTSIGELTFQGTTTMNKPFEITMMSGHDTTKGLKALEAAYIEYVYDLAKYNQSRAAKLLGISRGALRYKLKEYFNDKYI